MNEATVKLVEALAAKLGTTSEYLFAVLMKQAPIDSAFSVAVFAFLLWASITLLRYALRDDDMDDPRRIIAFIVGGIASIASFVFATATPIIYAGFFNPEYWALKQLLSAIGK